MIRAQLGLHSESWPQKAIPFENIYLISFCSMKLIDTLKSSEIQWYLDNTSLYFLFYIWMDGCMHVCIQAGMYKAP